jgi:TctA family transporter
MFCAIGVFSLNNSSFDIYLMALFGLFGYICLKLDCEPAPLLLGYILGPMMEEYLRRALLLSHGDAMVFVQRPISAVLLGISTIALLVVLSPALRKKREVVFVE